MILSALNDYYEQLEKKGEVPLWGYSKEKISYVIHLSKKGKVVNVEDIRINSKKKIVPEIIEVPQPRKRSINIAPCFLWDKTSYALGVTAKTGKNVLERLAKEHTEFKREALKFIGENRDEGLRALLLFLESWLPEKFETLPEFQKEREEIKDTNIIFKLDGERNYIHDRPAARKLVMQRLSSKQGEKGTCLVTGEKKPVARLHPAVKEVKGTKSSGASICSFNLDASKSYNKRQGLNSPVSERVAFQYTTALGHLLKSDRQKVVIGDTTVVFWGKSQNGQSSKKEEQFFANFLDSAATDEQEKMAEGRPWCEIDSGLDENTKLSILGIAPNASRLSIRYWESNTLGFFIKKLSEHFRDSEIKPSNRTTVPSIRSLFATIAPYRGEKQNFDEAPSNLTGEILRSVLTGRNYPQSLLSHILMRFRNDGRITESRVALCKAILTRKKRNLGQRENMPVALDQNCRNKAYLLGRLFGELENAQKVALGKKLNSTIKDRYYGTASAAPASIFPSLIRNCHHHLNKAKREKEKQGAAYIIERRMKDILSLFNEDKFPKSFKMEQQGHFALGHYHQANNFKKRFGNGEGETYEHH